MKTIVFAVAGYNLAETGRHIEIARACKGAFNIIFLSYGGNFESLMDLEIPSNVIATGFLPAHKVNPMADISVIHGGQNTVMNACLSGTPIVGVRMHPEQQANLDACVRKGFAIRLNKKRVTALAVLDAVDKLLNDTKAKEAVKRFQSELMKWDGPANAAKFLFEKFG